MNQPSHETHAFPDTDKINNILRIATEKAFKGVAALGMIVKRNASDDIHVSVIKDNDVCTTDSEFDDESEDECELNETVERENIDENNQQDMANSNLDSNTENLKIE